MSHLEPIDRAPRRLRPPHDVPDLLRDQRFGTETTAQWRARVQADNVAALMEALDGIPLGSYDRRIVDWLAGYDIPTIAVVASLLHRARWAHLRGA
jgi:hypothetical protein